jgi:predicted nucleic acid-binding protein
VRRALTEATHILTSELTLVECDRALIRARTSLNLGAMEIEKRRALLETRARHWTLMAIDPAVIDRARRPFPVEPIRTLDALHLASALGAKEALDDLAMLSLDHRVRSTARAMGLRVLPSGAAAT